MKLSRFIARLVLTFIMVVTFSAPPSAFATGPGPSSQNDSNVRSIETRVVELSGSESSEQFELKLDEAIGGEVISSITTLEPDDVTSAPLTYILKVRALAAQAKDKIKSAVAGTAKVSTSRFKEWFMSSRVNIIVFEVTLMSGLKLTELVFGPQEAALAPALAASLMIGGIIGYVEWYTPQLVRMYTNHNSYVKALISKLNERANDPALSAKVRHTYGIIRDKAVDKGYWFFKNASINTFLYFIFKIILYASLKADGTVLERVVNGFNMINSFDVAMFFALGYGATGFGMPTSEWIVRNKNRVLKEAGNDPEKLKRVDNLLTLWWSTALTARAAAFSSLLVGYTMEWPALMIGATGAILGMTGGSMLINRRSDRLARAREDAAVESKKCELLLEPELPGLFDKAN